MAQATIPEGLSGSNLDGIIKTNTHTMENMTQSYSAFLHRLSKLNAETMQFYAQRWKEDLEVPAKIAQSRAPEEVAEVYAEFYRKMFNDYSDQAYRVMNMVGELHSDFPAATENGAAANEQPAEKPAKAPAKKAQ